MVKMVAREANRNGIVFVDLKGLTAATATSPVSRIAAAFGVREEWALEAIPQAVRAYHKKTKRPAVIIIEDAQGALRGGDVELILAALAKCVDATAANLVFLSSEGGLPTQLRKMSGWSKAVQEYRLNLVDEKTMREHLVEEWKLDVPLASDIVDRIGCGMRDVFDRALKDYKPGALIDLTNVNRNVDAVIEEAKQLIQTAITDLNPAGNAPPAELMTSRQRAAVLLLDRLLTTSTTTAVDPDLVSGQRPGAKTPSIASFYRAQRVLVHRNVLRFLGGGDDEVTWHGRPAQTAYAAVQRTRRYNAIREGQAQVRK